MSPSFIRAQRPKSREFEISLSLCSLDLFFSSKFPPNSSLFQSQQPEKPLFCTLIWSRFDPQFAQTRVSVRSNSTRAFLGFWFLGSVNAVETMMKRDIFSKPKPPKPECKGCQEDRWVFLHLLRIRGSDNRFCTSCVLKVNQGAFCPVCFEVYEGGTSPTVNRVVCSRCPSVAHSTCVKKEPFLASNALASSSYMCPQCSDPNFVYFDIGATRKKRGKDGNGEEGVEVEEGGRITKEMAKVLLAAAEIASNSIHKVLSSLKGDAEKRVKEAADARRKAREELEKFCAIADKGKEKMAVEVVLNPIQRVVGHNVGSSAVLMAQKRLEMQASLGRSDRAGGVGNAMGNVGLRDMRDERLAGRQALGLLPKEDLQRNGLRLVSPQPVPLQRLPSSSNVTQDPGRMNGFTATQDPGRMNGCRDFEMGPPGSRSNQEEVVAKECYLE